MVLGNGVLGSGVGKGVLGSGLRGSSIRSTLFVGAVLASWAIAGGALAGPLGAELYETYCAACHGTDAKGSGPVAEVLKIEPSDLTQLGRRFGMPLDRDRVAKYIDGRMSVLAHGPRDMPVWGNQLTDELIGQPATEDTKRRTIDAIVDYLVSIQRIHAAAR